jgi:hypothetical protein
MRAATSGLSREEERRTRILEALTPREREALHRFYCLEQESAQILQALRMNEKAFRELKAGVKKDFQRAKWSQ